MNWIKRHKYILIAIIFVSAIIYILDLIGISVYTVGRVFGLLLALWLVIKVPHWLGKLIKHSGKGGQTKA